LQIKIKVRSLKSEKPPRLLFFLFCLAVFAVYLTLVLIPKHPQNASPAQKDAADEAGSELEAPAEIPLQEHREIIQRGETLSDILPKYDFNPQDIHQLREETKAVYDLAKIKAGHALRFYCDTDDQPVRMEYDINQETYVCIERTQQSFHAEIKNFPIQIRTKLLWGSLENNLISAVNKAGEKDQLAILLADIFAWDVDFYADIRRDDSFKIIYEKKFLEDEFVDYGRVLAAEFINQKRTFQAFRYEYPDTGKWDYFTLEGQSLRKEFLKSPINGARITSRYSHSRFHPVWKVYRPHHGVDYGAPTGTPVQATADGTVIYAGRKGGNGNYVHIRHQNAYETMYLHLSRFGRGIRKGVRVAGGQVIGYVGATGVATGPHLDYRIKYHGSFVNPLAHKFKPVSPLRTEFLPEFQEEAWYYRMALNGPLYVFLPNIKKEAPSLGEKASQR
jgi:murein DD-endopeptidase MepM/ murein hydrolase activator NlpD